MKLSNIVELPTFLWVVGCLVFTIILQVIIRRIWLAKIKENASSLIEKYTKDLEEANNEPIQTLN